MGCLSVEDALTPRVVCGIEAAKQLLEIAVRIDRYAEHLAADATIEAFDHAIGLGGAGFSVPIGGTELCAGLLEGPRKATAIIGQHMREAEREGCRCFLQEGNGTLFGFIVLDR